MRLSPGRARSGSKTSLRLLLEPERQEQADRLHAEPMSGERQGSRRGSVQPLDVVHRDDHRRIGCKAPQDSEHAEPDCPFVGRHVAGRREEEGNAEGARLRLGKLLDRHRRFREQVGDAGEGEASLGLERPSSQDASPGRAGRVAARQPERRLPGSRLALEQERAGPIAARRDEQVDQAEFLLPPDDLVHHRLLATMVPQMIRGFQMRLAVDRPGLELRHAISALGWLSPGELRLFEQGYGEVE